MTSSTSSASRTRRGADAILDGMTTAVIAIDAQMAVLALNPAAETLFGVSERHALGDRLPTAVPHFTPYAQRFADALTSGAGFIERELSLRRGLDQPLTIDLVITPVLLDRRPGLMLEATPLDRHLRISRDEWLAAQFDASRQLIRGLAHEIKNPLGGLRGAAQLLERELPDAGLREYTGIIIREADRLQRLVNRMLGPNRLPEHTQLNLHEVLEHVRRLIEAEAGDRLVIQRDYDPSIPDIEADREQLIQAVLNIVRNAMQALEHTADARIVLRTRIRRQHTIAGQLHRLVIQLDISDNGPGIEPALQEKIFYPMVTTRADGSGLGLPIAQYLVHGHGGVIECRSRPGATVFSLYLPFARP